MAPGKTVATRGGGPKGRADPKKGGKRPDPRGKNAGKQGGRGGKAGRGGAGAGAGTVRQRKEKASKLNVYDDEQDDGDKKNMGRYDDIDVYEYELPEDFEDEEIDEDGVFNDEDYEKYGDIGGMGSSKASKGKEGGRKRTREEESENDIDEDEFGEDDESEGEMMDLSDMLLPSKKTEDKDILRNKKKKRKGGDGIEDEEDEGRHEKLLRAMESMVGRKGGSRAEEVTEHYAESEFNLAANTQGGREKVRLEDLVGSLRETTGFGGLKKQLEVLQKGESLPLPMSRPAKERMDRTVAYDETKETISQWLPFVKRNREAEHLSFPLNEAKANVETNRSLADKFKPETELEKSVSSILTASVNEEEKGLGKSEELMMKDIDYQEIKERRKELAKMRALLTYYEKKRQRINKIKSKNYHKRLKKEKLAKEKRLTPEQLQIMDGEEGLAEFEKAERQRAEERMTLRHKNTSKWAQRLIQRGNVDPNSRAALAEQLRLGQELKRKITLEKGSDDEDEGSEDSEDEVSEVEEDNDPATIAARIEELQNDLDTPLPTTGLLGLKFMQRSLERQRAEAQKELEEMKRELEGKGETHAPAKPLKKGGRAKALADGEMQVDQVSMSAGHKTQVSGFLTVELSDDEAEEGKTGIDVASSDDEEGLVMKLKKGRVAEDSDEEVDSNEDEDEEEEEEGSDDEANPWIGGEAGAEESEDSEGEDENEEGEENEESEDEKPKDEPAAKPKKQQPTNQKQEPSAQKGKKDQIVIGGMVIEDTSGGEDESDDSDAEGALFFGNNEEQRKLIERAFAGDNVVAEFDAEKKALDDSEDEADKAVQALPGWGSWAGDGVKAPKKKPEMKKVDKKGKSPRQDTNLKHVIINEKRDKKAAAKLVKKLPHPYSDRAQFERSLQAPIGKEWNTPQSFQKNIKPKVTTKAGAVIAPAKMTKEVKERKKLLEKKKERRPTKSRL